jgi:hypothetical protein
MTRTWILASTFFALACEPAAEYRAALPSKDTVMVDVPEQATTKGGLGTSRSALVGEKSDFYSQTYHASRDLNALGAAVVGIVEAIADHPPTKVGEDFAIWGPFSDNNGPNELMMTVERKDAAGSRYDWRIEARHESDVDFAILAAGTFEPNGEDFGRGWFHLDFDAIGALDPTEDGRGRVAYAFEKTRKDVSVRLHFRGPNEQGDRIEAGYAFGEDARGNGFFAFAFPGDIHEEEKELSKAEDIVILTRWITTGAGRADVVARNGDLGAGFAHGTQCWDERFVSRYEVIEIDGTFAAKDGDAAACVLDEDLPGENLLPSADDVKAP